jgi:hypothetical protein
VIVLKTICCFLIYNLKFTFFRGIAQKFSFCMLLGNPLANLLEIVGNLLENLLQAVEGYRQPSGKFVVGYQKVLATLRQMP